MDIGITDEGVRHLRELRSQKELDLQIRVERDVLLEVFNAGETGYPFDPWEVEGKVQTPDMGHTEAKRRVNTALRNLIYQGYLEGDLEGSRYSNE